MRFEKKWEIITARGKWAITQSMLLVSRWNDFQLFKLGKCTPADFMTRCLLNSLLFIFHLNYYA